MIHHHPGDELLVRAAAGTLDAGAAIVIGAHLEGCAQCRAEVRTFESVGGAMLEASEPATMAPEALARTLAMIDAPAVLRSTEVAQRRSSERARRRASERVLRRGARVAPRPDLPSGVAWPRSLADCAVSRWRWMGPGMRWSRVTVPHAADANVFLLRIGAGKALANHTHSGLELTQVLCGSFDDGRARFSAGDFDAADDSVHHQPVLEAEGECVCLASVDGRLLFDSAIARAIGSLVGI